MLAHRVSTAAHFFTLQLEQVLWSGAPFLMDSSLQSREMGISNLQNMESGKQHFLVLGWEKDRPLPSSHQVQNSDADTPAESKTLSG